MVGVPRSKACISCRARRKGCDAQRPSCSQCLQRGVSCPGYATGLNIVFEDPGSKRPSSKGARGQTAQKAANNTLILLPSFLETAYRSQTHGRFFETYLPHSSGVWSTLETDFSVLPSSSWLHVATTVAPTDTILDNALTALALAHVGRIEQRHDLRHSSRELYTKALRGVNRKLSSKHESLYDTTLAAVMTLSIYEMQEGSSEGRAKSWVSHVKGASTLVHLRGRQNFATALSHRLFLGTQLAELINAIGERKSSSNATLWSRTLQDSPSTVNSKLSSPMRLFEILHFLPAIMEQGDRVQSSSESAETESEEFINLLVSQTQQCQEFESLLTGWYTCLASQYGRSQSTPGSQAEKETMSPQRYLSLYWYKPSTLYRNLPDASPARIFPSFICFPDPDIAQQLVLYWTCLLLMHSSLHKARAQLLQQATASFAQRPALFASFSPPEFSSAHSLALLITQSMEYFLHPDMGLLGTNFAAFPIAVAQGYFEHIEAQDRECRWFGVLFERIREMCSGLGGFLDDMAHGNAVRLVRT